MRKKLITAIIALSLVLSCMVGITVAWLSTKTTTVTNTFTPSDITITLDESDGLDLQMVPGKIITKDPVVTVKGRSEACWLFIKIDESANFDNFMTYELDGWTVVPGESNIYYRQVPASTADQAFHVIAGDTVTVRDTVTKQMMNALTADTYPTLKFTAYAIQQAGFDAAAAWTEAQKLG